MNSAKDTGGHASPPDGRRQFLKQCVAGLAAGASAFPAIAQEKTEPASAAAGSGQISLAEGLAHYAAELKYEDLPEDVVRIAKRTILDTFGCAFGGYAAQPSRIAMKLAGDVSAEKGATVLCGGFKSTLQESDDRC